MTHRKFHAYSILLGLLVVLFSAGCAKKAAKVTPAAPPLAPAPAAVVASKPASVEHPKGAAATPGPSDEELFAKNVKDVFFDFNKSDVRADETSAAQNDGVFLREHPNVKVMIEGHCDDRGSIEYNLALGTSRAESVKQTLLQEGVSSERVKTISYGKEKPFCTEDNEQCWQQNRVDHFAFAH
ncbi:MAG TPA: peptidoglycan-associated lipoprotein Pal [Terriglobales bacterium]|nr:peptidoglycan-associated lipoprotein Pal [Terriglobales bacterium]